MRSLFTCTKMNDNNGEGRDKYMKQFAQFLEKGFEKMIDKNILRKSGWITGSSGKSLSSQFRNNWKVLVERTESLMEQEGGESNYRKEKTQWIVPARYKQVHLWEVWENKGKYQTWGHWNVYVNLSGTFWENNWLFRNKVKRVMRGVVVKQEYI